MSRDLSYDAVTNVDARYGYSIEFANPVVSGTHGEGRDELAAERRREYDEEIDRLIQTVTYVSRSGREWTASPATHMAEPVFWLTPLGPDVRPAQERGRFNGGVRRRLVPRDRLEGRDPSWQIR